MLRPICGEFLYSPNTSSGFFGSDFVALAKTFSSKIKIRDLNSDEPAVNAKSIVMLLSLGLAQGAQAELSAEGEDAQRAVEELAALISSGFGEV